VVVVQRWIVEDDRVSSEVQWKWWSKVVVCAAARGSLVVEGGFWSVFMVGVWWLCGCVGDSLDCYTLMLVYAWLLLSWMCCEVVAGGSGDVGLCVVAVVG